jgi:hypothetical protein
VQIIEKRALNDQYSGSIWKNIIVHKAENRYSRRTRDKNEDIAINIWNIEGIIDAKSFSYTTILPLEKRTHYINEISKMQTRDECFWQIFG